MDDVYSQNKAELQEFLRAKRSSSFDNFTGHGARHDADKVIQLPLRHGTAKPQHGTHFRKLMKPQKKFYTEYDRGKTGDPPIPVGAPRDT